MGLYEKMRRRGWSNDTLLQPDDFYMRNINREFAIRDFGRGDHFNDFLEYVARLSSDGLQANILQLQGLIRRHRIDRK